MEILLVFWGIGDYTTGVGDRPDNSVNAFFNRLETFGGLPNEVNTALYGSDSFLASIEGTEIRDSSGNVVKGTLDCSKATGFTPYDSKYVLQDFKTNSISLN